jgi:CheY-like chemotaxis protein
MRQRVRQVDDFRDESGTKRGCTIPVTVQRDADRAVMSVSDTDIGVPPDYLNDVFGVSAYRHRVETGNTSRVSPTATESATAKTRRILVVDDNDDAAALLAVLLELEGHDVQTAANGGDAVVRAELFRPEVVLMDLEMPGVDGFEASRRIRARPWGSTILIAALTGWGQDVDRRRAREAGVDLHFVKPVDTTALLGVVARSLDDGQCVNLP